MVEIEAKLQAVIEQYRPEKGSVESLFFHKDPQAAAKLGHARGVVLLCLQRSSVGVAEYAPAQVKAAIVGNGRAEKLQVANMIKTLLCLDELPQSDAADALALAVTHLRRAPILAALAARSSTLGSLPAVLLAKRRRPATSRPGTKRVVRPAAR
jgi:crossover junction endodeoxyribonuclease RuvC